MPVVKRFAFGIIVVDDPRPTVFVKEKRRIDAVEFQFVSARPRTGFFLAVSTKLPSLPDHRADEIERAVVGDGRRKNRLRKTPNPS